MNDRRRTPGQLGLFGPLEEEQRDRERVAAAPVPDDVRALADRLPATLRLGTSSWNFAGWRGLVYADRAPAKHLSRRGLDAYAQHPLLRTVGVDRGFYAPVPAVDLADYAAQVPDGFRFLVKAWGELLSPTTRGVAGPNPRYLDAEVAAREVVRPALQGLGDKLGVVLLQLPPQGPEVTRDPALFAELLATFVGRLPDEARYAVELRDEALLTDDYRAALEDAGAVHCYCVHPRMPSIARQRGVAPPRDGAPVVARWMLHAGFGYDEAKARYEPFTKLVDPAPDVRAELADLCRDAMLRDVETTVVVNNKAEGSAPASVLELVRELVRGDGAVT